MNAISQTCIVDIYLIFKNGFKQLYIFQYIILYIHMKLNVDVIILVIYVRYVTILVTQTTINQIVIYSMFIM